jgi:hypothetical protein
MSIKSRLKKLEGKLVVARENPLAALPDKLAVAIALCRRDPGGHKAQCRQRMRELIAKHEAQHGELGQKKPRSKMGRFLAEQKLRLQRTEG